MSPLLPLFVVAALFASVPDHGDYFKITVIDQDTGRGVPLVELRTVNEIRFYTDSAGVVAVHEPGLMKSRVFFEVSSHGYGFVKDGFGYSGARLPIKPGGSAVLEIRRINIAERLYRMTGAGIYRDSVLVGDKPPTEQPLLGEIWYAESDTPLGPWGYARKVVTHDKYSFYNPKQHLMLDQDGGRTIVFEGTYTNMFSGNPDQTPRYNYNQIMYKLDLTDPRLVLPVPVYDLTMTGDDGSPPFVTGGRLSPAERHGTVRWFALDRPSAASVPIVANRNADSVTMLIVDSRSKPPQSSSQTLFHALPADLPDPPETTVPLYESASKDGKQRLYSTQEMPCSVGYQQSAKPLCLVWRSPTDRLFP